MVSRVVRSLLMVLVTPVAASYGSSDPPKMEVAALSSNGEPCTTDADCNSGLCALVGNCMDASGSPCSCNNQGPICVAGTGSITCPSSSGGTCICSITCGLNEAICGGACVPESPTQCGTDCHTCDDGNACTTDSCVAGACVGTPVVCTALDQCHDVGSCDPATGICSNPAKPDGTSCSDGNACTTGDSCSGGACVGGPLTNCDDGNVCTDDFCNPTGGCEHVNNVVACDTDRDACTEEICDAGSCRLARNRRLCFAARCPGGYTGPPVTLDPTCTDPDNDHDGFTVAMENAGWVDMDCNGSQDPAVDFIPFEPFSGDGKMDLYVELDYGTGLAPPEFDQCVNEPGPENVVCFDGSNRPVQAYSQDPDTGDWVYNGACVGRVFDIACSGGTVNRKAVDIVTSAFAARNIALHVNVADEPIPTPSIPTGIVYLPRRHDPDPDDPCLGHSPPEPPDYIPLGTTNFYDIKDANLATSQKPFVHYAFSAQKACVNPGDPAGAGLGLLKSGAGELGGEDLIVAVVQDPALNTSDRFRPDNGQMVYWAKKELMEAFAGTSMHEVGHNLALCHGDPVPSDFDWTTGADPCAGRDQKTKPNQISVMSYDYQLGNILRWADGVVILDYSDGYEPALDTGSLDDSFGLGAVSSLFGVRFVSASCTALYGGGTVFCSPDGTCDWNCSGNLERGYTEQLGGFIEGTSTPEYPAGALIPAPDSEWAAVARYGNLGICGPQVADGAQFASQEMDAAELFDKFPPLVTSATGKVMQSQPPEVIPHDSFPAIPQPPLVPPVGWITISIRSTQDGFFAPGLGSCRVAGQPAKLSRPYDTNRDRIPDLLLDQEISTVFAQSASHVAVSCDDLNANPPIATTTIATRVETELSVIDYSGTYCTPAGCKVRTGFDDAQVRLFPLSGRPATDTAIRDLYWSGTLVANCWTHIDGSKNFFCYTASPQSVEQNGGEAIVRFKLNGQKLYVEAHNKYTEYKNPRGNVVKIKALADITVDANGHVSETSPQQNVVIVEERD